ncbi:MAG: hypothetical protein FWF77_09255 [Defluviitaleaceae bacterium]|nr:hypothetical protein [Defluviitaleaceae bacterium]
MITHIVELTVPNADARSFYDFMINPTDERYSQWWPGEHLQFHIVRRGDENHLGDTVFMDEFIGPERRLTFHAVVAEASRPNKITWRMKKAGVLLPATVDLVLNDCEGGVHVRHELRIGFGGIGKILDPFIRLYFTKSFRDALEEHCKIEWPKLANTLFLNIMEAKI